MTVFCDSRPTLVYIAFAYAETMIFTVMCRYLMAVSRDRRVLGDNRALSLFLPNTNMASRYDKLLLLETLDTRAMIRHEC